MCVGSLCSKTSWKPMKCHVGHVPVNKDNDQHSCKHRMDQTCLQHFGVDLPTKKEQVGHWQYKKTVFLGCSQTEGQGWLCVWSGSGKFVERTSVVFQLYRTIVAPFLYVLIWIMDWYTSCIQSFALSIPKRIATSYLSLFVLALWVACGHLIFLLDVRVGTVSYLCDLSGGGVMALT